MIIGQLHDPIFDGLYIKVCRCQESFRGDIKIPH